MAIKPRSAKQSTNETSSDPAVSYNEFKEYEGQRYTGMKIGRSHKWHYDGGDCKETKVSPDLWQISYAVTKRRAGHAPEGSGVPVGTEYHWYVLAHQNVGKQNANDYTTSLTGLKFKIAHKGAGTEKWSATPKTQRKRMIMFLQNVIADLEKQSGPETMSHRRRRSPHLSGTTFVRGDGGSRNPRGPCDAPSVGQPHAVISAPPGSTALTRDRRVQRRDGWLGQRHRLNRVVVDPALLTVRVEGGTLVSELMTAWRSYGLVTPTGGCPEVGLGGLTLGGGENMLMARFGAACDNVLTTEVLLAGGRLVTANPREHADLFWAIRGGGGNFGIVTTFEHELFRLDFVLSGLLYFPVSRTTDVRLPQFDRRAPDELQTRGGLMGTRHRPRADRVTLLLRCSRRWRWRTWLRPVKDTVQAGLYTAEFSIGDGPSSGGGAFLPS
jgi:hypothetical protein